ncbi:DUF418 domain-containing protein [Macrococcus armenti]|uniref:DUF418 domain-containing protein n=1 Tax=Macrococcus armenti TaxID=2875764 RepID=A0ABY3ZSW7_9STAP|nr:DUF418 domain-containing protein [Macrococcus armenti]UOB19997.1 DUF418 domain-containing protein [Macrococcus armenti]
MKRLTVVDSLRGWSLFGVALSSLIIFQYGYYGDSFPDFYEMEALSKSLMYFVHLFIEGSFLPIFAVLYGFGLKKMSDHMYNSGKSGKLAVFRKGLFVFLTGVIFMSFLYNGDILYAFGIITFILLFLIQRSVKTLIRTIFICILLLIITIASNPDLFRSLEVAPVAQEMSDAQMEYLHKEKELIPKATFDERNAFWLDTNDPFLTYSDTQILLVLPVLLFSLLPLFITGIIFEKIRYFETGITRPKKIFVYIMPILLLYKALMISMPDSTFLMIAGSISSYMLGFSYISAFYIVYLKCGNKMLFNALAATGRLAFTNYVIQLIVLGFVCYGYGMQYFGNSDFVIPCIIIIGVFIIQMIVSSLYVKRFKYGPLEYVMRLFTYWTFKPKRYATKSE